MNGQSSLSDLRDLCKYFPLSRSKTLKAVDRVTLGIRRGEVLGLVGESGCGKTTIGRLTLGLLEPTSGKVLFDGIDLFELSKSKLRQMRRRMQIVFQDPHSSLNPRMTVGHALTFPMEVQGLFQNERRDRVLDLLNRVGLKPSDINRYPHEFSGGQLQRIGIAKALILQPEFVVADEPVSALDVSIQSQVLNLFKELQEEYRLTCLFISHDLSVVEFISDRIAVLYMGRVVETAPSSVFYKSHRHPYSKSLLSAVMVPDPRVEKAKPAFSLTGEIPSPVNPFPGCRFSSRCAVSQKRCREAEPELIEIGPDHRVACFLNDR